MLPPFFGVGDSLSFAEEELGLRPSILPALRSGPEERVLGDRPLSFGTGVPHDRDPRHRLAREHSLQRVDQREPRGFRLPRVPLRRTRRRRRVRRRGPEDRDARSPGADHARREAARGLPLGSEDDPRGGALDLALLHREPRDPRAAHAARVRASRGEPRGRARHAQERLAHSPEGPLMLTHGGTFSFPKQGPPP